MDRLGRVVCGVAAALGAVALVGAGCGPFEYERLEGTGAGSGATGGAGGTGGMGGAGSGATGGEGGMGGTAGMGGGGGTGGGMNCTQQGEVEPCYSGPADTEGVGPCKAGERTCTEAGVWGPCENQVFPTEQDIAGDLIDNDCDGTALVGPNPVVRYLINEAEGGVDVTELKDSSPNPLNLTMTYVLGRPTFATDSIGRRGLHWNMKGSSGRASVEIDQSKAKTALNEKPAATLEIVANITDKNDWARLIFIGHTDTALNGVDHLSFMFDDNSRSCIYLNNARAGCWPQAQILNAGRVVIHAVLDTALTPDSARSKLYLNGSLMPDGTEYPAQNTVIDLTPSTHLVLGNRPNGLRSPIGTIYYAAVYAAALTEVEIQTNAALLLFNDDQP